MLVTPIKTYRIRYYEQPSLEEVLVECLPLLTENTVVAITSKIVSLCEGNFVYRQGSSKAELIREQSDLYITGVEANRDAGKSHTLTITAGMLVPAAGIDSSKDLFILWPSDPQYTSNRIRKFLASHYQLRNVGVIITDSTSRPLRRGVTGTPLAHSGFMALTGTQNYKKDVSMGLASAAVLAMGEGSESTPLATITQAPFIEFVPRDPTPEELADIKTDFSNDLFHPLLTSVNWVKGKGYSSNNGSN